MEVVVQECKKKAGGCGQRASENKRRTTRDLVRFQTLLALAHLKNNPTSDDGLLHDANGGISRPRLIITCLVRTRPAFYLPCSFGNADYSFCTLPDDAGFEKR